MARVYLDQPITPQPKKRVYLDQPAQKTRVYLDNKPAPQKQESVGAWRRIGNQLVKPLAASANLLEDTGKSIGYQIARQIAPEKDRGWEAAKKQLGIDFGGHQADVWTGKNKRTYSDIMSEMAGKQMAQGNNALGNIMIVTGVAGDFLLDPLNKVKIGALTKEGEQVAKTGNLALSAGEQARKGQRALLQFGNTNILPSAGNRVLASTTKANDFIRGTKAGGAVADILSKVSTSIRPSGVSRADFKTLAEARTGARLTQNYTKDQAIQFAKGLEQTLRDRKASDFTRSQILHAIEKGDKSLVPQGLEDVFEQGVAFKTSNEKAWQELGGSTLENYGLAHVANDRVAEEARKGAFKGQGMSLSSTKTPQDIHRDWVKINGKIGKLSDEGVTYSEKTGQFLKGKNPVNIEQATAQEINNALAKQGKEPIFKEDLPTVVARMGISTGRKQAGVEFLEATKGLEGKAKELANEAYEAMTNVESLRKGIKYFDNIQNIWKAQVLVAPSYHIRNEAGNLWNNFLAGIAPDSYIKAGVLQKKISSGNLTKVEAKMVDEMKKLGVIGSGQYGGDLTQAIADEVGGSQWLTRIGGVRTPIPAVGSQRFGLYKGNRAVGSAVEDNAKIAHYLSKIREGFAPKQAAESVRKYLFDYGDLTWTEQNILKRVIPFYCVPEYSEILTRKGWKTVDEINKKDIVLTYNVEKDISEWQSVDGVAVFEHDEELLSFSNKRHEVLFTPEHRWVVRKNEANVKGHHYPSEIKIVRGNKLNTNHAILMTAKIASKDSVLTVNQARLLGWLLTDGYFRKRGEHIEALIYQSPKKFLKEVTEVAGGKPRKPHPDTGVICVPVLKERVAEIKKYLVRSKVSDNWIDVVTNLSIEALEAMFEAMYLADGTTSKNRESDFFATQLKGVADTFEVLATLLGYRVTRSERGFSVSKNRFLKISAGKVTKKHYRGRVWCPKTKNGTWFMKQGNVITITGNTWTRKNVPLQIQAFFESPGKFSNAFTAQRQIEKNVEQPNERYLSDYIKSNTPIRISTNSDGTTSYLLLGQWLPAASAIQMLTQDPRDLLNMISPVYKVPKDMLNNQSFFKDSLGQSQPIEKYPGELKSFLGVDMEAKTANVLRNIRVLSELDKLNPGLIFGGKDTPSMIPGGSQNRGAKQSPDAPELTRWRDFLTGKTQTYNPENSKYYYDKDTQDRMNEYTQALNQALRFKNQEQAKSIIQEMQAFQAERGAGKNKTLDQYNLMGDQYLQDRYKESQAEFARDKAREQMKELVKQGVRSNNPELLRQAAQLDPTYIKEAIKNATEELGKEKLPDSAKRMLYNYEKSKTEKRLNTFYTK